MIMNNNVYPSSNQNVGDGYGKEENKINSDSKLAAAKKVMTENLSNYRCHN